MDLNDQMEIDHVVYIGTDGSVTDAHGVYAPEINIETDDDGQIIPGAKTNMIETARREGWELLTGWTGQYLAGNSPIMHASEYIGGGLADHILANPGYYVACTVETLDDSEDAAGWVVAFRDDPGTPSGSRPCGCRDCFETAIGYAGALCNECEPAGCTFGEGDDCQRDDAYGAEDGPCDAGEGCTCLYCVPGA